MIQGRSFEYREENMRRTKLIILAFLALWAVPALAQDKPPPGPPVVLRGTVEKFDMGTLVVKTAMGDQTVAVAADAKITGLAARMLSDIKPNDFIGVTAVPGKDGKQHATEIHIFPEPMRGLGEGHRPIDEAKGSSMTNAAVSGMVDSADGKTVKLGFKNKDGSMGTFEVVVDPATPIVIYVGGDQSLLKPGAAVVLFARKNPDGGLAALAIVAEKDGVKPPM
jgi:Domain of unknown function (DUF5666)